ncbi:MAG: type II toxin-antitoxin system Phd/YefM family antitoxin [Thiohalospira sp.]
MKSISVSRASGELEQLMDEVAESHCPVLITGSHSNAVLIGQDDWAAMRETLFLESVSEMGHSIREGMATPLGDCESELDW